MTMLRRTVPFALIAAKHSSSRLWILGRTRRGASPLTHFLCQPAPTDSKHRSGGHTGPAAAIPRSLVRSTGGEIKVEQPKWVPRREGEPQAPGLVLDRRPPGNLLDPRHEQEPAHPEHEHDEHPRTAAPDHDHGGDRSGGHPCRDEPDLPHVDIERTPAGWLLALAFATAYSRITLLRT